jgi:lambda repressor-like predicted transcriptional regulator
MHPQLTDIKARVRACNRSMADVARAADLDYSKLVRVVNGYARNDITVSKAVAVISRWESSGNHAILSATERA